MSRTRTRGIIFVGAAFFLNQFNVVCFLQEDTHQGSTCLRLQLHMAVQGCMMVFPNSLRYQGCMRIVCLKSVTLRIPLLPVPHPGYAPVSNHHTARFKHR